MQRLSFAQAATQRHFWKQDFSLFEFMHYFLEKLIMLIMKIEKHPVAMQIWIAILNLQDFSFFFINIRVDALILRKSYHDDNED